jgi:hypothetical protein
VIPGSVIVLEVVVGVFAAVDAVCARIEIVLVAGSGVVEAGDRRRTGIIGPRCHIMARGETRLYDPLLRKLEGAVDPSGIDQTLQACGLGGTSESKHSNVGLGS